MRRIHQQLKQTNEKILWSGLGFFFSTGSKPASFVLLSQFNGGKPKLKQQKKLLCPKTNKRRRKDLQIHCILFVHSPQSFNNFFFVFFFFFFSKLCKTSALMFSDGFFISIFISPFILRFSYSGFREILFFFSPFVHLIYATRSEIV